MQHVVQSLEGFGVLVYFLPPYSPDLNPIEESFSKVLYWLKENEVTMQHEEFETLIVMAFSNVTSSDCRGWIQHAHRYVGGSTAPSRCFVMVDQSEPFYLPKLQISNHTHVHACGADSISFVTCLFLQRSTLLTLYSMLQVSLKLQYI